MVRQRRNPKETADLTSVQQLLEDVSDRCNSGMFGTWNQIITFPNGYLIELYLSDCIDAGLLDIVKHCTYIGMADDVYALLQHNTHLYLANVVNLR